MRTLIAGLGEVVSGDIGTPRLDADSILIEDGRISAIGLGIEEDADVVVDAKGVTAFPGLIDSHVHPVFGDWAPRQRATDFIESELHGGVTSMISAGEVHLPGRPKDIVGLKALAIVAVRAFANVRPAGVKVHAGAPILELGLEEADFAELAAAGVNLIGEVGLGSVKTGAQAAPMLGWARQHGMVSTFHTGGPSIAGSSAIRADVVLEARPDIVGHINGGTTALPDADIELLVASRDGDRDRPLRQRPRRARRDRAGEGGRRAGPRDPRQRRAVGDRRRAAGDPAHDGAPRLAGRDRTGDGRLPGHRQHRARPQAGHGHDRRRSRGDIALVDAPQGSTADSALGALAIGDLPGVGMILIDGKPVVGRSRNTPPAGRAPEVVKGPGVAGSGH